MPTTVDAHHHVWSLARGDYGWLTSDLAPIHRDFALKDLAPLREQAGISGTVLVQAAPTVAETQYLLDVAARSDGAVLGVVGWADLAAPDAIPVLTRLARNPLLKAVRPMLQDMDDDAWILRAEVGRTLGALPRLGLRFDALVRPAQLPALLTMLDAKSAALAEAAPVAELAARWLPTGLIGHVQVNDRNRRGPGQGSDRFAALFRTLRAHGYAGDVAVEPFDYVPDGPGCAARAIGYLRGLVEALDVDG